MKNKDYFDVLHIIDNPESVDMIQALMGNKCLGTFFKDGSAKLYFNNGLREQLDLQLGKLLLDQTMQWSWETQDNENWHLTWQDHFKPVVFENKLAIIPPWAEEYPAEIIIRIKPGMAFGTGHHETTWLMLQQIIKYIKPNMSILDLGAGSGILSIVAKKMGAILVDSVEYDLECESNFYENLKINKIIKGIEFHHKDVLDWHHFNYDLILANINLNIIQGLIPRLKVARGTILLSGILETDYETIDQLCQEHDLQLMEKMVKGEWICLAIA